MRKLLLMLLPVLACIGCSRHQPRYVIGVSQCSADIWREKQNAELRMANYLHNDVELRFAAAYDSDERQIQQIDSLVATGIDLLIVAPNQVQTISPAIDHAYDRGIPVIVFERKTNSKKYTAFISADNYEMGRQMGQFIATQLQGRGRVLEIMGLRGSSPAIERHKGFADAIALHPGIQIVATLQGDWTEKSGYDATRQWLSQQPADTEKKQLDYVFGQNDRMAMGARKALAATQHQSSNTLFCGIDGLPGEGGGIQLVRDSLLEATYIYPTHGDQLLDLAISILEGRQYKKEVMLKSALVTHSNANVLLMQSEEMNRQISWIDQLHNEADTYLHELDTQRLFTISLAVIVLLVSLSAAFVVVSMRRRHLLERQVFSMVTQPAYKEIQTAETDSKPAAKSEITDVTPEEQADIEAECDGDTRFLERLRQHVMEQMSDSDFSVETLAAQMGVSRVQLYRKVKMLTGRSPVDIIRLSRLNRSKVLLAQEGTTVSEIAYAVGFSSPSYFTKCFKEEFGMLPGDVKGEK